MPRRNKRVEYKPPEDLTPAAFIPYSPRKDRRHLENLEAEARENYQRQRQARMLNGIDWSVCLVPGCGTALIAWKRLEYENPKRRDVQVLLPLCLEHAVIAWQMVQTSRDQPTLIETNEMVRKRTEAKAAAAEEAEKARFLRRREGDIYFVRLGPLVKVGWSRDLYSRLKSYGASAEVLCHYPATRDDEMYLHRQLKPARAAGNEWYEDGPVIAMFLQEALNKYGPPTVVPRWTEPKRVVGSRNYR